MASCVAATEATPIPAPATPTATGTTQAPALEATSVASPAAMDNRPAPATARGVRRRSRRALRAEPTMTHTLKGVRYRPARAALRPRSSWSCRVARVTTELVAAVLTKEILL